MNKHECIAFKDITSLRVAKALIKRKCRHMARKNKYQLRIFTPILTLYKKRQTIIFRLRTGHCHPRVRLYQLNVAQTGQCFCQNGPQTLERIFHVFALLGGFRDKF